jgi:hypothetical protein
MGHVICIYPYVPIFLFRDSPDFAWRTKNSLRGEFNIEKGKLNVYKKRPTGITDTNQAYFVKTPGCALQEILYTFGQNLSNNISGVTPQLQLEIDPQGRGGLSGENLERHI